MRIWSRCALIAVGLIMIAVSTVMAEEPFEGQTQEWRGLFFTMKVDTLAMEQLNDNVVGAREMAGLAFYDDGEVATVDAWVSFFVEGGQSHYEGFARFQFPDGSTQTARLKGCMSPTGAENGDFEFLCGSGRFRGITGTGSYASSGFSLAGDPFVHAQTTYRLLTD